MKTFNKCWFTPEHQREGQPEVQFELQPLDQRALYIVQSDFTRRGIGIDGATAAFEHCVVNWKGIDVSCTPRAKRDVLSQVGNVDWLLWLMQIAADVYTRALLSEDAAKNS